MKEKFNSFSVPLALLDYINPILYGITCYMLIKYMKDSMLSPYHTLFIVGAVLSLLFGLVIPTGKLIVGLGIIKFRMPVILVFLVNIGIFISGMILFKTVFNVNAVLFFMIILIAIILLILFYLKNKKMNTIAVLTGALGYLLIYISLIICSIHFHKIISIIFYCFAICLFIMLCGIGINANLKNPKIHWIIEISNVICQLLVTTATILLFQ